MTQAGGPLVSVREEGGAIWIALDRPARHNSIVPELIDDLRTAVAEAVRIDPVAIVLTGTGRSFSTGGDLAGFLAHAADAADLAVYADRLVAGLNDAILDLLIAPVPVIAAVNGPATGGALGLILASDIVAMAQNAFVQPYYTEIGFAPDGGWTALLPERIGAAAAVSTLMLNRRIGAEAALALGLADAVTAPDGLAARVDAWVAALAGKEKASLGASRRLVRDARRLDAVRTRLEAERRAFVSLIARPVVIERMRYLIGSFGTRKTA